MSLRTKLLATIGVLYLVALVGIGVYAVRSADDRLATDGTVGLTQRNCLLYEEPPLGDDFWASQRRRWISEGLVTSEQRAEASDTWQRVYGGGDPSDLGLAPSTYDLNCLESGPEVVLASPGRPAETLYETDQIVTALIASTLIALVSVGAILIWTRPTAYEAAAGDPASASSPTGPYLAGHSPTLGDQDAEVQRVTERLRQLKTLHDDGILTDEEYETKRQALADQL